MKKFIYAHLVLVITVLHVNGQSDETMIKRIFDQSLTAGKSYEMLRQLTLEVGPRLSGSPGAAAGVEWGRQTMELLSFDSVWLQPVMVPHWVRGAREQARIISSRKGTIDVNICALGGSVGTGPNGISAQVVEVKTFEELKTLGAQNVRGKIVFYNRPFDPAKISTFDAYGGAVDQRVLGASQAAQYGAVASIVRSMSPSIEEYPHTGSMQYTGQVRIPSAAISTMHADVLSSLLKEDPTLSLNITLSSETLPDVPSHNVVGEIKGTSMPEEIILVGGHLDSWDLAQGAHDDGTGCVQSIEVLRILKAIGYTPNRTIRAVLFMNEENGLRGGTKYAELALANKENHIIAIESDRGGFTPRGFTMTAPAPVKSKITSWKSLLEPYGLTDFSQEGGGADIGPLGQQGVPVMEFLPDSQRYFSYHHTPEDTFDKVSKRELEMGAASMAALVYLIDKYGLK